MDMNRKISKSAVTPAEVLDYAQTHPELVQSEIARDLGISQKTVCRIYMAAGIAVGKGHGACGRAKIDPLLSDEEKKWERILQNSRLCMGRGCSINGKNLVYGHVYRHEAAAEDFALNM
jgi:hypothetical protein